MKRYWPFASVVVVSIALFKVLRSAGQSPAYKPTITDAKAVSTVGSKLPFWSLSV